MNALRIGLAQINGAADLDDNLETLRRLAHDAAADGAQLFATPEMSDRMGLERAQQLALAQPESAHAAIPAFRALAQDTGLWLLIGSIAVLRDGVGASDPAPLANRSLLIGPGGDVVARYDKIHMFDVDVGDGRAYRESETFHPGDRAMLAPTPWGGLGMTICYDLRFPHLYRALAQAGAKILSVPAAFTKVTGEAHWHALLRARAIETGCFVIAPAQTGRHANGRQTYGHALIVAPWGEVLADGGDAPGVVAATLALDDVAAARGRIPAWRKSQPFAPPVEIQG